MQSIASLAQARNERLVSIADTARYRALKAWQGMDFDRLDASWASVGAEVVAQVSSAQAAVAAGADRFTAMVGNSTPGFTPARSAIIPEAFMGIDGQGRDVGGVLYGAITTTKKATGAGFGRAEAMQAGATYLAAILKTVLGDISRSADLTSSAGRGFTHYVRVCNAGACSRCAMLAGISSAKKAFARHVSCQCSAVPAADGRGPRGMYTSPEEYFESLSEAEQDRVFTKAGAEAIRDGADISKVVSARRGAAGIGYASHGYMPDSTMRRLQKTTIGYRPNGTPVQVYATSEGTTVRGEFGRANRKGAVKLGNDRYSTTQRVRLMPEEIMHIAGDDVKLRQAFLRDAGYLEYRPPAGVGYTNEWVTKGLPEQRRLDRILVDRATLRYGNFTLG